LEHDAGGTLFVWRTRRGDHETFLFWDEDSGVMDLVDQRVDMGVFRLPRTADGVSFAPRRMPVAVALETDATG
jgi:hypothetical protein